MKKALVLATFFVASAGAAGAGASHFATSPYAGSDTEFNIQNQAIENSGLGNTGWTPQSATSDYAGGGSGAGEAAMAAATQQTAPMSRMLKGGAGKNACASTTISLAEASGIVIGIDAARVFASAGVIDATAACNGGTISAANSCTETVGGLAYDTANGNPMVYPSGQNPFQNWRDVLALLYGGLDKDDGYCSDTGAACNPYASTCNSTATCNPITDCNSQRRQNLIGNWAALFENSGCANPNGTALTHAFRRDDNSGTSDVFSNLLGMQSASVDEFNNKIAGFSVSSEAVNSFGQSPYCNVLNWDTNETASCPNTADKHYVGPGGVALPPGTDASCTGLTCGTGGPACLQLGATCSNGATCIAAAAAASSNLCHHVPPYVCAAKLLCANGTTCTTAGTACSDGSTCTAGTDNRCWGPNAGMTIQAAAYGSVNIGTQSWVFPTSYQDNDPVRTTCLGTGASSARAAEDVCNTDGKLGVVLPIPPLDFVPVQNAGTFSYTGGPAAASTCQTAFPNSIDPGNNVQCTGGSMAANAPQVYTCAPRKTKTAGACPNNDKPLGIGCLVPVASVSGNPTPQCWTANSNTVTCFGGTVGNSTGQNQTGGTPCGADGRVYNEQILTSFVNGANVTTAQYVNFTVGGVALNDTGGYGRIHQKDLSVTGKSVCHLSDATQQIGCLVNADPSAVGYGGNTGDSWEAADPLSNGACSGETVGLRVHELGAGIACTPAVPGSGQANYPLWRKLYMNTLVGFSNIAPTSTDTAPQSEQELAEWESETANIDGIMVEYGEFQLPFGPNGSGPASDGGAPVPEPFCEDFNEYGAGCAPSTGPGNQNGCAFNAGVSSSFGTIPSDPSSNGGTTANPSPAGNTQPASTTSTVCGNGVIEDYEDCDPGTPAAGSAPAVPAAPLPPGCGSCSSICRCSLL